jgi:hypothetical protein
MENFGSIDSFPQSMTEAKNKYKFLSKMERYLGISRYDGKIDTSIQGKT